MRVGLHSPFRPGEDSSAGLAARDGVPLGLRCGAGPESAAEDAGGVEGGGGFLDDGGGVKSFEFGVYHFVPAAFGVVGQGFGGAPSGQSCGGGLSCLRHHVYIIAAIK